MAKELANQGVNHRTSLKLNTTLDAARIGDRSSLLTGLDRMRSEFDRSGMMDALDRFNQQAAGILLSGHFAAAMDLDKEDPQTLARYTAPTPRIERFTTADNEFSMRKLLLARRLVEAGVRCVSVSFSDSDSRHRSARADPRSRRARHARRRDDRLVGRIRSHAEDQQ
jgi:hypothetical protein